MPKISFDRTALGWERGGLARRLRLAWACSLCLVAFAQPLHAQEGSARPVKVPGSEADLTPPNTIDEQHPENSLPTSEQAMKNPLKMGYMLMDLIARAEAATEQGDHQAAIRYYRAIAKAVPDRAISFSKLCRAHETVGQYTQALETCREALGKGGVTGEDYARYVRLVLRQKEALTPVQVEELDAVLKHLTAQLGAEANGKVMVAQLACEVATRLEDRGRLAACSKDLLALAPTDARTFTFRWALALKDHDLESAQAILSRAKASDLPLAALSEMEAQLAAERARPSWFMQLLQEWGLWSAVALVVAFGFIVLLRKPRLTLA